MQIMRKTFLLVALTGMVGWVSNAAAYTKGIRHADGTLKSAKYLRTRGLTITGKHGAVGPVGAVQRSTPATYVSPRQKGAIKTNVTKIVQKVLGLPRGTSVGLGSMTRTGNTFNVPYSVSGKQGSVLQVFWSISPGRLKLAPPTVIPQ